MMFKLLGLAVLDFRAGRALFLKIKYKRVCHMPASKQVCLHIVLLSKLTFYFMGQLMPRNFRLFF